MFPDSNKLNIVKRRTIVAYRSAKGLTISRLTKFVRRARVITRPTLEGEMRRFVTTGKRVGFTWYSSICLSVLFLTFNSVLGVDPARRVSQYGHTAWRMQDGIFNSTPNVIMQTQDGYIWIGTQSGLVRFDGARFVPGATRTGQPLPDVRITSLRSARDGSL